MSIEPHYSAEEIADRLGVSISTVYRHMAARRLHSVKAGRSRRVPESALHEWLNGDDGRGRDGASVIEMRGRR